MVTVEQLGMDNKCTKCGEENRVFGQRWCTACRASWMRYGRKPLSESQRMRANARSYAKVYLLRGKLERGLCEDCGRVGEEMHHDDYSKPLEIRWFCRVHHLQHHAQ